MALLLTTTTPPGILTKTSWYVTMKLSTLKSKGEVGATIYSSHQIPGGYPENVVLGGYTIYSLVHQMHPVAPFPK